jgi:integrase
MDDLLLSTAEVAAIMGCSVDTIRRRVADGTLQPIRLTPTGPLRFNRDVLPLEGNVMIRKRADRDGWPYVDFRYTDPDGISRRVKVKCPSRNPRACVRFEQEIRAKVAAGVFRSEKEITVRDFAPTLLAQLDVDGRKPSYIHEVKRLLDSHIVPYFGSRAIRSIRPGDITKYKQAKKSLSKKTINNHLGVLSRLLRLAVTDGIITAAPPVKLIPNRVKEAPYFTADEADKLVAACSGRLRTMVIVALNTGLRLGELIALQWDDIDLAARILMVRRQWCMVAKEFTPPKNGEFRSVPLPPRVLAALSEHPKMLRTELVFPTASRRVLRKDDTIRSLRRACKRAELEGSGWHKCRHTYASWLVQRGVDLYTVQKLLGHKTIQQTQRYAHLAPATLASAVEVLG